MNGATTGLPAYSGPEGLCPRCGLPGAMTEWHWAGPLASPDMAGRTPPCAGRGDLVALGGEAEHLCRVCLNCGYGWPEACTSRRDAAPWRVPPPAVCAALFSLAGALASAGAGSLLRLLLGGVALVVMWLAVTVVISVAAATGCAAVTGRGAGDVTIGHAGREHCR